MAAASDRRWSDLLTFRAKRLPIKTAQINRARSSDNLSRCAIAAGFFRVTAGSIRTLHSLSLALDFVGILIVEAHDRVVCISMHLQELVKLGVDGLWSLCSALWMTSVMPFQAPRPSSISASAHQELWWPPAARCLSVCAGNLASDTRLTADAICLRCCVGRRNPRPQAGDREIAAARAPPWTKVRIGRGCRAPGNAGNPTEVNPPEGNPTEVMARPSSRALDARHRRRMRAPDRTGRWSRLLAERPPFRIDRRCVRGCPKLFGRAKSRWL